MANTVGSPLVPPKKHQACYLPKLPPSPSREATSYTRAVMAAPVMALMGVVVDGRKPDKFLVTPRCRIRKQVGSTNRWRLPDSLGSDLLGSTQAIRAIKSGYNDSMKQIITAESPMTSLNMDMSKPYSFRAAGERPMSMTVHATSEMPDVHQTGSITRPLPPATAPAFTRHAPRVPGSLRTFLPGTARPVAPLDIFLYHSKKSGHMSGPDVLLHCLNMNWELHRPYLRKSDTLSQLLQEATSPEIQTYYREKTSETLDNFVKKNQFYDNPGQETGEEKEKVVADKEEEEESAGLDHPKHVAQKRQSKVTVVELKISDPLISKNALAIALGNLYHEDADIDKEEVVGVMAAAYHLKFRSLMEGCVDLMLKTITPKTVCAYHQAALKYEQSDVINACERWLELNLIPQLSTQIELRQLPMGLLQKMLRSHRLFVYNEYAPYKLLAYWLFLQLNPEVQLMPSFSTVITFFNNMPKTNAFIERQEGQYFLPLFSALRLHGIMDTNNIKDMQQMNVLPQSWIIKVLTQHYHALQAGGDMASMNNFDVYAVRQGFVMDEAPDYHSEVLSLHGFHFELKAVRQNLDNSYSFFMQCERHTFSMRPDREVRYCINVQTFRDGKHRFYSTGVLSHKFGFTGKATKSEVLKLMKVTKPLYVSYTILFPPS